MSALARRQPVEMPIGGDTIVTIPRQPNPVRLCVEDPESRQLTNAPHANLFKVRLANTRARHESASYLIRRRYAWRGYSVGEHAAQEPTRIAIAAHDPEGIVGTVTVGLDSPDGLFIDGLYADVCNRLRAEGRQLAEFTKLAVDNNIHSKPLLAALFHIAYICARRIHGCTDLLIEVNPRHAAFYRRMLGFEIYRRDAQRPARGRARATAEDLPRLGAARNRPHGREDRACRSHAVALSVFLRAPRGDTDRAAAAGAGLTVRLLQGPPRRTRGIRAKPPPFRGVALLGIAEGSTT